MSSLSLVQLTNLSIRLVARILIHPLPSCSCSNRCTHLNPVMIVPNSVFHLCILLKLLCNYSRDQRISSVTAAIASQATLMMLSMFYEMKLYSDHCTYAFIYMNKENMIPVIVLVFPMFNGQLSFNFWGTKKTAIRNHVR